ncbi:MAG TPA: hypothetical protein VF938_07125, partial [Candidatus Angelobacter sp.]
MARLSSAQEQASEAATEKHDSSSKADATEAHSIAKTPAGTQPGLLKRFLDDQQRVWTSPTKLAEKGAIFIVRADGSVSSGKQGGFWSGNVLSTAVGPGDTVVVPERPV